MIELLTLMHGGILATLVIFIVFHRWNFLKERGTHALPIIASYFLFVIVLMVRIFTEHLTAEHIELWITFVAYIIGILGFFWFLKYNDTKTQTRIFRLESKVDILEKHLDSALNSLLERSEHDAQRYRDGGLQGYSDNSPES